MTGRAMPDIEFRPRPAQQEILAYHGGRMGVSAVPGAGKTFTLSKLAADLVATTIDNEQEVLIVTLVNSAVENFKRRVSSFIEQRGLLANIGYRVRTLHGLAHDIVRERPGLVGLADDFQIVDEREADQIRENVVEMWLRSHPDSADAFLDFELRDNQREWVAGKQWPETVLSIAGVFIKRAKDLQFSAQDVLDRLESFSGGVDLALAQMGAQMYADYQKALYYRGGVDFDDLIRLALVALERDQDLLARLRYRWPFVLEDEAQDSSLLQERILDKLVGPVGNWVRVGDPNQAINTTFTTANPDYLRRFLNKPGVLEKHLDNSGRSQQCIIDLANCLVEWTMGAHPEPDVRDALHAPPIITPAPPGDPQPNPEANPAGIYLFDRKLSPEAEIKTIVDSLRRWLPDHPDDTVAVLVPRNQRGFEVTDALKRAGVPCVELLRSTTSTRKTAGALGNVLQYLANPASAPLLSRVFEVWRRNDGEEEEGAKRVKRLSAHIRKCRHVEEYLWPYAGNDWLDQIEWAADRTQQPAESEDEALFRKDELPRQSDREMLIAFRDLVCRWQEATLLPIDQLVLTVAQDLFINPGELALSHKLAMMLRAAGESNPSWRLGELTEELAVIARNQRRFLGFDAEDTGFEPKPGEVTISTLHKAKGLEWDRVYVMSVNNYNFPSAQSYDSYISEKWFIQGKLNLEAEALAQLQVLVQGESYAKGAATEQARLDYVRERLRLLYVGMTRAKKELILTWNTGRSREAKQMAVPFIALYEWWQQRRAAG
ncbi:MAG: ATP-dependent helicase [Anaerolineae bacterium]|nr:ATP-dependent helicase [Anaerolineae bacterium]